MCYRYFLPIRHFIRRTPSYLGVVHIHMAGELLLLLGSCWPARTRCRSSTRVDTKKECSSVRGGAGLPWYSTWACTRRHERTRGSSSSPVPRIFLNLFLRLQVYNVVAIRPRLPNLLPTRAREQESHASGRGGGDLVVESRLLSDGSVRPVPPLVRAEHSHGNRCRDDREPHSRHHRSLLVQPSPH